MTVWIHSVLCKILTKSFFKSLKMYYPYGLVPFIRPLFSRSLFNIRQLNVPNWSGKRYRRTCTSPFEFHINCLIKAIITEIRYERFCEAVWINGTLIINQSYTWCTCTLYIYIALHFIFRVPATRIHVRKKN